ncbi:hypothetical protein BDM02DRAFT_3153561 [Thelephora ganbajun]|uniref:Uncharacterized protein n=1 Tax=Thelephora ganbajun TaxID=370292 RepID=A0ACB6ZSG8_THEGA|nr:hypothetical protein BDM02DRAFT_3153561 [Thelephora ganbajun]
MATPTNPPAQSSRSSSFVSIPQTAAAGGLTITKPAQTATSYFKIAPDELVTFAWNFTYLYVTPQHLTVSALCENGYTYPVGPTDGVIPGDSTSVVWDPYAYNQAHPGLQLPQARYTLAIWDERGPGAVRQGGVFNPNTALTFALYTPQAYTPLASGWQCPACSGGPHSTPLSGTFVTVMATLLCMFLSGFVFLRSAMIRNRE